MQRSEHRILVTHAGSLPRPPALVDLLTRLNHREPVDADELAGLVDRAVAAVVQRQLDVGIDIANDGEQGRESFFTYVQHRMSGFGGQGDASRQWQDMTQFPGFLAIRRAQRSASPQVTLQRPPKVTGEIRYLDEGPLDADCARLQAAAAAAAPAGPETEDSEGSSASFAELFLTAPSPGIVAAAMANDHYPTMAAYVDALADALAVEYRRIVGNGLVLQIDAPDLAMERHTLFGERPLSEFLAFVDLVVEAINRATAGLAPERIRLHVCWGNYGGPHTHDVPLAELLDHLYPANVGGLLLSMANPRHGHEHRELARNPPPPDMVIAAGVIDVTTNYVEHPELVADRIEAVATALGDPTRVLAATDCGFDTAAGFNQVADDVAWEKLRSLRAGADLASQRLF